MPIAEDAPGATSSSREIVAGIFVGGRSMRMGGRPKGNLPLPDGSTPVRRAIALFESLHIPSVLVGEHPAYLQHARPILRDSPPGIGPLGGLSALLQHAGEGWVIALACDMPFVDEDAVRLLVESRRRAAIVAPRSDGRWESLFSIHRVRDVLPEVQRRIGRGEHSLQALLDACAASELHLPPGLRTRLRDWDSPEDVLRDLGSDTTAAISPSRR